VGHNRRVVALSGPGSPGFQYLAAHLASKGLVDLILFEAGREKRNFKARRRLRQAGVFGLPRLVVDFVALTLHRKLLSRALRGRLALRKTPRTADLGLPIYWVDSLNSDKAHGVLRDNDVDVLLVQGTSLLNARTLSVPHEATLNVHGGILPRYRNVHCDVAALLRDDYEAVGASLVFLDLGIDTGDLYGTQPVEIFSTDTIVSVKWRIAEASAQLAERALIDNNLASNRYPQGHETSFFCRTPGAFELMRLWLRTAIAVARRSRNNAE